MYKRILVTLLIFTTLLSCSLNDDVNSNLSLKTLPIKEAIVPDSFDFGDLYEITIFFDLPDGCHSFYNLFYQHDGTARIVAVNSLFDNAANCTLSIIEKQFTFTVEVTQQEDYTFRFWKGIDNNGDDIFEEVVVPVIL